MSLRRSHPGVGNTYDLHSLFERLNRLYFDSELVLDIRWSLRKPSRARTSVELGNYCDDSKTITISRRLDNARVPLYFVEYVVFHEMLHAVFPRDNHRMHTPKFKQFERMHPDYARASQWEKESFKILFEANQSELPFA